MKRKKILIWGEAGVGKTTFCHKFCQDWALVVNEKEGKGQELTEEQKSELEKLTEEQKSKLYNIGLLVYIVLRDIDQGAKSVKNIILSQLGFHKEGTLMSQSGLENQFLQMLKNVSEQSKLVFVLDGFDEISDKDEKYIKDVITGQTYQNIYCITTCRPHATSGIVLEVDVEIRLKGFSWAQAESFVKMYAAIKYTEQDQIDSFVKQTMHQIKSSTELRNMSINPSMLQLLCRLLDWNKGKTGKNRTSIFKDYTRYLLVQYHNKLGKKEDLYSDDLYEQNLLDAGKVALMGLKKNQLQLVFSKREVQDIGGDEIFKIGFFTDPLSTDTDSVKVQFIHKTLQEYLAAFYVVNTPGDEGLQLLMQFCSTSNRLMGSQIILEFISNMSPKYLGEKIQNEIKEFVLKCDSDVILVRPEIRTSFLISMLEGIETLKFPLPAVIDIGLRFTSFKKLTLERFFAMDGQGVRKINLTVRKNTKLNMLQNTTITSLDELKICLEDRHWESDLFSSEEKNEDPVFSDSWFTRSREDNEDLCRVMNKVKPGLLHCDGWTMDQATIDVILHHVHTLILKDCFLEQKHVLSMLKSGHDLKDLTVIDSSVVMDRDVIEAVSKLPSDIELCIRSDRSYQYGEGCITLMHKPDGMKSLSIYVQDIDTEIAEAVSRLPADIQLDFVLCDTHIYTETAVALSRLPDDIQYDLSSKYLCQIDQRLIPGVLLHMPKKEFIDMIEYHNTIDADIVKALSKMPELKSLSAFCDDLTEAAAREFSMSQLQALQLIDTGESDCDVSDNVSVSLMISLSKHCPMLGQLDLSVVFLRSDAWCHHVQMKQLRNLYLYNCGIDDTVCESLMKSLSKHCPLLEVLYLHNEDEDEDEPEYFSFQFYSKYINNLTSDAWCHHVKMKQLFVLNLSDCGIDNTVCVSLMNSLSKHCPLLERLYLEYNNVLSSGVWKTVDHIKQMKNLRLLNLYRNPCVWDEKCMEEIKEALQESNPELQVITWD